MKEEKLFQEFGPVSTEQWKEKIIKDLKGADYDRKLVWHTDNGFNLQPFYRLEDLDNLSYLNTKPGEFPFTRGNEVISNKWNVNQCIQVDDLDEANKKALEIRLKGVDAITFIFDDSFMPTEENIEKLLENIRIDLMELNYVTSSPKELIQIIESLARKYNRELDKVKGSIIFDAIADRVSGQNETTYFNLIAECFEAAKYLPSFHVINIDGSIYQNAGATTTTEMAFTLAHAVEYLNVLTDKGFDIDEIGRHIRFKLASGSSYFIEIAKLRAMRFLWAKIMNEYGINNVDSAKMYVHAISSQLNKSIYDPYVNMLRTTTETMSAALGGADTITVVPFDNALDKNSELGQRIARNQQLLLKGESYFDKVQDPAAGSYYIENITNELIENAWKLFLEIEENGGFLAAFNSGFIVDKINNEASKLMQDVNFRKKIILGTNQYPNINETYTDEVLEEIRDENSGFIQPLRAAASFELLRNKTDIYALNNPRPKVWMFTYGNLAMRKARSQFAGNFFGCAGFEIIDNSGFKTIEQGIEAAKAEKPDIVVICSSDDEYAQIALDVFEALKNDTIVVLAGYPKTLIDKFTEKGFTNFVHVKSNVLAELKRYQNQLGIN